MTPTLLQIATIVVALVAVIVLTIKKRYGSILLSFLVIGLALVVRAGDWELLCRFALVYIAFVLALPRIERIVHGLAAVATVVFALTLESQTTDWKKLAHDKVATNDIIGAYEAFDNAYEANPDDLESLDWRASLAWNLQMPRKALADVTLAKDTAYRNFIQCDGELRQNPTNGDLQARAANAMNTYARLTRTKCIWIATLGEPERAIEEMDGAQEHGRLKGNGLLVLGSAELRITWCNAIQTEIVQKLEKVHPERIRILDLFEEHLRSAKVDNPLRMRLVAPIESQALRDDVDKKLATAWRIVREADEMVGDIRARPDNESFDLRQLRARIDTKLGRLLRAKEELQCILQLALPPYARAQNLMYLVEVLRGTGSHYERALRLKEIRQILGGDAAALAFTQDYLEALFEAADAQADLRPLYIKEADLHLGKKSMDRRKYEDVDMRTLGYRGVAALRFENNPTKALKCLRAVYDALRVGSSQDDSARQPKRAKLFVESMLDAALNSPNPTDHADGIEFANILLEVATNDIDLRKRRAALLESEGRFAEAAEDLKVALRHSKLDHALFNRWLDVSSKVKDAKGNTPRDIAAAVAISVTEKMAQLRAELAAQDNYQRTHKLRQSAKNTQNAFAGILNTQAQIASDPLIAWHMSAEFGRMGRMADARDFLFKAVASEPEILPFKLRLGELRLDLGLYAEAARDFQNILERDPDNVEVVQLAYEALTLSGDLKGARALRRRAIDISPQTAGIELGVRSHLENGNQARALELLGPRLGTADARVEYLSALARLADGKYAAATKSLRSVIGVMPDSADVQRGLLIALANLGDEAAVLEQAQRFVKLPRLLPLGDVIQLLDALTAAKQHKAVGFIANEIYARYSEDAARQLWEHGVLGEFRAGNAIALRQLIDDPSDAADLGDAVVHAAFGVALRERGAFEAARFLQAAREYTDSRDDVTLITAAAFALTPHVTDVSTFLSRYELRFAESRIPVTEVPLWWCVRQRASVVADAPPLESGVETELSLLSDRLGSLQIGDENALDVYLRFRLFEFAGEGFEADARKDAEKLLAAEPRLASAARYVATEVEKASGAGAAAQFLMPHYQTAPNDLLTFSLLARLVADSDPDGKSLFEFGKAARALFPSDTAPVRTLVLGAIRQAEYSNAVAELDALLDKDPRDREALELYVDLARTSKDHAHADAAVSRIVASQLGTPKLFDFLVEFASGPNASAGLTIQTIGPVYQLHPEFYRGAEKLASALAETNQKAALTELVNLLVARIANDPDAATSGDSFSAIAATVSAGGDRETALSLVDAALDIDPVHPSLRRQRYDLLRSQHGDQAALDELEVLCTMAPRDSQFLFNYVDLLLQERGDRLDVVREMLPYLRQLSPEDPRYFEELSKLYFLKPKYGAPTDPAPSANDQIRQALLQSRAQLVEAIKRAPGRRDFWYRAGLIGYLIDDAQYAKIAFEKLDPSYKLWPRVQYLLKQMEPPKS